MYTSNIKKHKLKLTAINYMIHVFADKITRHFFKKWLKFQPSPVYEAMTWCTQLASSKQIVYLTESQKWHYPLYGTLCQLFESHTGILT